MVKSYFGDKVILLFKLGWRASMDGMKQNGIVIKKEILRRSSIYEIELIYQEEIAKCRNEQ
jgi:hypothetical protein